MEVLWETQCRAGSGVCGSRAAAARRPPRQLQSGIEWLCLNLSDNNFVGLVIFALIKRGIGGRGEPGRGVLGW